MGWSVSRSLEAVLAHVFQPTFIYPIGNRLAQQSMTIGEMLGLRTERVEFLGRCAHRLKPRYSISELPTLPQNSAPNVLLLLGVTSDFLYSVQALEPAVWRRGG